MSAPSESFSVQRILVALDASQESEKLLESAAELAARLQAEVVGLFVEDVNLLNLAALPFARQFNPRTGESARIESAAMERELQSAAGRGRRALEVCCGQRRLRWSYRVSRGKVPEEILAASQDVDLVVLGRAGDYPRRRGLGSAARAAAERAASSVLLVEPGVALHLPVVTIYDGSEATRKALHATARLLEPGHVFTVLVLADSESRAEASAEEARAVARTHSRRAVVKMLVGADAAAVHRAAVAEGARTFVISAGHPLLSDPSADGLLDRIGCTVLLVR